MSTLTASPITEDLYGSPGYSTRLRLDPDELSVLRDAIEAQWRCVIVAAYPEMEQSVKGMSIAKYHEISANLDHSRIWCKAGRMLPQQAVDRLKSLPFLKRIRDHLGEFTISKAVFEDGSVDNDLEEVYWRLVRPGIETDVGPLHTDKWFHRVLGGSDGLFAENERTIKLWIPVFSEAGRNGLCVVPNSHRRKWRVEYVDKGFGAPKPRLDEHIEEGDRLLLPLEPGQFVMFGEDLLHGGALNRGTTTRVSTEITLVFDDQQ